MLLVKNFVQKHQGPLVCIFFRGKTNFFEKRVGDYQKAGVMSSVNGESHKVISFDEDF